MTRTLYLALLLILFSGMAFCLPAIPSLLTNPDCSVDQDNDKWPDDWPRAQGVSWEVENGTHFLRFKAETPGKMVMVYRRVDLPNPTPAALEIRFRLRYTDVQHGKENWNDARFFAHFKNLQERVLRPEPSSTPVRS